MKFSSSRFLVFLVATTLLVTSAYAQVVEIPDPNLEKAIREELNLPDTVPITQQEMLRLTRLSAWHSEITDLTGLEYAIYLNDLGLNGNQISDLKPLAELINLQSLGIGGNQISDISPLANLTNLIGLDAGHNKISDITPLANLTKLEWLNLIHNSIGDISPLANLTNLWLLHIQHNRIIDITPLQGLNLTDFLYDKVCEIEPLSPSIRERIENKSFPSTFRIWGKFVDLDQLRTERPEIRYDMIFGTRFWFHWQKTDAAPYSGLSTRLTTTNLDEAREHRQRALDYNPDLLILKYVHWHYTERDQLPPDSEFWLRDENDQIVGRGTVGHIDYFHPGFQDLLVERIVAIANCGLYDGIVFDDFVDNAASHVGRPFRPQSTAEAIATMTNILSRVRSRVHEDFLILVNANRSKLTAYTEYINGSFMETVIDYPGGYTLDGLKEIENALLWNEENLREPRINCLAGYSNGIEHPDSPTNRRWMRLFTTMGLTLSDGYVVYHNEGIYDHIAPFSEAEEHYYRFWGTNLGRPIEPTVQLYQNIEGLFIREFTHGWAVYNRSGEPQTITLPTSATPVSDRGNNAASPTHLLPDFDGEMYLRIKSPYDLNGDYTINTLDLIIVANNFGTTKGDVNGDGTTNIFDLTLVVQQFSQ